MGYTHFLAPNFDRLVAEGWTLPFYGVANLHFKVGPWAYRAVEDPDDGYRSLLGVIEECDEPGTLGPFFAAPLATVRLCSVGQDRPSGGFHRDHYTGYALQDVADGHIWLLMGTDTSDDYYPCFVFAYTPRR